ncbi:MAG TPA: hypothetical protein VMZ53_32770 [Kofleriaceae bacterium]|nr:hypothetical protein [Kofleriaceae bacterium]
MRTLRFSILSLLAAAGACTPYNPDLGESPFLCGPMEQSPRCPDGYACVTMNMKDYCVAEGGSVPVDARPANCADDSQLEPNDTIQQAFQTPVATQKNNLTFAGLSVCPAGDKDTYSITITTANQNLEMLIEYDDGGAELQGSILNSGGVPIANASAVSGMNRVKRAYTPNLPVGTYYAQAYGPNSGSQTTNNYKLTVNVTGP